MASATRRRVRDLPAAAGRSWYLRQSISDRSAGVRARGEAGGQNCPPLIHRQTNRTPKKKMQEHRDEQRCPCTRCRPSSPSSRTCRVLIKHGNATEFVAKPVPKQTPHKTACFRPKTR